MKKTLILLVVICAFTACKSESKNETDTTETVSESQEKSAKENEGLRTLVGQFVYYADAAVLQTKNDIYGVVINDKAQELIESANAFKTEPTDYVTVQVKGKLIPKPENEEGWPYRIDIKEIDNVKKYESNASEVIKLGGGSAE